MNTIKKSKAVLFLFFSFLICIIILYLSSVNWNYTARCISNDPIITMKTVVNKLCSDEFEGRLIGSPGNTLAEKYINDIFKDIGLEKFGEDGFYSSFPCKVRSVDISANNIIGKISGLNHNKAIVLSAHFDHIGKDDENIYRGAIDNASGIAALIQLASYLKSDSLNNLFEYDIVFAAFNYEEKGIIGSEYFADKFIGSHYDDIININIDSIGYKESKNVVFFNTYNTLKKLKFNDKHMNLINSIKLSLNKYEIDSFAKELGVGSDDYGFQKNGYTSITISEENIRDIIHTTADNPEMIDYSRLNRIVNSLRYFINTYTGELFIE